MLLSRLMHDRRVLSVLIIVGSVLFANGIYLTNIRNPNPVLSRANLTKTDPGTVPDEMTIDPNDGFVSHALGSQAAEQWFSGEIPYWNHYEGMSSPLAGEMQSAVSVPLVPLLRTTTAVSGDDGFDEFPEFLAASARNRGTSAVTSSFAAVSSRSPREPQPTRP